MDPSSTDDLLREIRDLLREQGARQQRALEVQERSVALQREAIENQMGAVALQRRVLRIVLPLIVVVLGLMAVWMYVARL